MSTQNRSSGGGRNQKKLNSGGVGSSGGGDSVSQVSVKKTDASKTEKEKIPPKPTAEQLRIAQITNSNASEDPQMREKVATLIETTQRSEEEVCCALYECDNNLDRAVVFLLETLPVGAFETSSKKKKNKTANASQDSSAGGGGGDGDWLDANANTDRRDKSRNRSSNRGGRGSSDSRGWRGREARENERNLRDSRGADRGGDDQNYRSGQRGGGGRNGAGGIGGASRGGGYVGRGGRGGGRMGGGGRGSGGRGDRTGGGYGARSNHVSDDQHQEVELWDNTIAQNAEKQQQQSQQTQDDAWGDWDNEEYVGSLKDSKVFTTSNLPNQTAASVVAGGSAGNSELSAPPGLEHHLAGQGSHLNAPVGTSSAAALVDETTSTSSLSSSTTPMMQYSAAVTSTQLAAAQQQAASVAQQQAASVGCTPSVAATAQYTTATPVTTSADSFSNAATAAANLVQQVQQQQQQQQQQQPQLKSSATLSAEQSQYFNSLTSQNAAAAAAAAAANVQMTSYGQSATTVPYATTYANVFGTGSTANSGVDQTQLTSVVGGGNSAGQQTQTRRTRTKLPPPSKIPATAVEMPGDTLNNIGYLDVQFGGLDFGTDDSFDALPTEKYQSSASIDSQTQQQQQLVQQQQQDVVNDYQSKSSVQQQQQAALTASLQNSQIGESIAASYAQQRNAAQQQQQQQQVASGVGVGSGGVSSVGVGNNALDQLTKNDPYSHQTSASPYQSAYQGVASKAQNANAYQQSAAGQGYNSSSYANVQASVANAYQPYQQSSYQQNSVNSYQQQQQQQQTGGSIAQSGNAQVSSHGVGNAGSAQNIPVGGVVGGGNSGNSATGNSSGYLSSGYPTQQSAYQSSQSVYGSAGLSNSTGYAGSTNSAASQYSNFSTSAKLKDTQTGSSSTVHFDSVSSSGVAGGGGSSNTGSSSVSINAVTSAANSSSVAQNASNANSSNVANSNSVSVNSGANNNSSSSMSGAGSGSNSSNNGAGVGNNINAANSNSSSVGSVSSGVIVGGGSSSGSNSGASSVVAAVAAGVSGAASASNKNSVGGSVGGSGSSAGGGAAGGSGMVPNIQMVSQYIQTGLPYYQQPVYSYEDIQLMQQRVPHVQGYYDINYTPTSLGAGRDNLGSVAYSAMTDGRFTRTDNNSSPVSNVSSTMSQQAGSGGPMLNVPYYFYSGNVMPGSFQYGTPAIYPQIPAANTASGGQFPKPSYNTGYGSTSYDALSQATQDYTKGAYPSSVNQQTKSQNVTNAPQGGGSGSDIAASMYGKGHAALNKVNSYEKQNFHSGTPPPFNMPNTQTAGGTSAQPYGMYLPMQPAGHHNMIHQPIHQMDGRIHNSSRRDSNSTGQRQNTSSQSKSSSKQGYSPSYWTGQN